MSDAKVPRILVLLRRLRGRPEQVSQSEVLGQCERAALASALKLRDELSGEVTALAAGPAGREDRVLAMALRAGCDEAVRVYDDSLAHLDYLGVARTLAAAARHIGFDLILCGDRSEDELQGATGPAIAETLRVPHLTSVVDVRGDGDHVVARHRAGGKFHTFRCGFPAVLCVTAFPRSRYPHEDPDEPHRKGPIVRGGSIGELALSDLEIDPRSLAHRKHLIGRARASRPGNNATMVTSATELVRRLVNDHVLG